jgi:hypothetical protein
MRGFSAQGEDLSIFPEAAGKERTSLVENKERVYY